MKVSNQNRPGVQNLGTSKSTDLKGATEKISSKGEKVRQAGLEGTSAKVDLSPRAQEMAKAKQIAMGASDIDEAKVERLQKLIDQGLYSIDSNKIADRMVDEHAKNAMLEASGTDNE